MKKVCHITSAHGSEDVRIFHKECVSLVNAGYEVYLVQRGCSYTKFGVHIIGLGNPPVSRLKRIVFTAKAAYKIALKLDCDIYHIHDPELLPYGIKLKKRRKKVIYDSHELTREQIKIKPYLPSFMASVIAFLYSLYENHVLKRIDGVIFPCPINGKFPLPAKNGVYLNNVPRLSELYYEYDQMSKKETRTVCTIGSLTFDRGIKHLILAADRAHAKLVLGGRLQPEAFETEILSLPESENVEFLGYLNREQVVEVYKRSSISVAALLSVGQYSYAENLPTKVYESMAMGIPVILTKRPFNQSMVDKYQFGVCVNPENIQEFADALTELIENPDKASLMGTNGRRAIKDYFNWELEEKKLLELYQKIEGMEGH